MAMGRRVIGTQGCSGPCGFSCAQCPARRSSWAWPTRGFWNKLRAPSRWKGVCGAQAFRWTVVPVSEARPGELGGLCAPGPPSWDPGRTELCHCASCVFLLMLCTGILTAPVKLHTSWKWPLNWDSFTWGAFALTIQLHCKFLNVIRVQNLDYSRLQVGPQSRYFSRKNKNGGAGQSGESEMNPCPYPLFLFTGLAPDYMLVYI